MTPLLLCCVDRLNPPPVADIAQRLLPTWHRQRRPRSFLFSYLAFKL